MSVLLAVMLEADPFIAKYFAGQYRYKALCDAGRQVFVKRQFNTFYIKPTGHFK